MTDPDDLETIYLGMICDCGDNAARAHALVEEVTARLALGSATFRRRAPDHERLLDDLLMSLCHDLRATVEYIAVDQWFAVKAVRLTDDDLEQDIVVQCDRPIYGLAAIWKRLADEAGLTTDWEQQ